MSIGGKRNKLTFFPIRTALKCFVKFNIKVKEYSFMLLFTERKNLRT